MQRQIIVSLLALVPQTASGQTAPQLRSQQHFLDDFNLAAIGLVLVFVMAILTVRRLWGRER